MRDIDWGGSTVANLNGVKEPEKRKKKKKKNERKKEKREKKEKRHMLIINLNPID